MTDINPITDPDSRMVSGPVNVLRLEGMIGNTPKVIYLFMDYHIAVRSQTQCANVFSQDVQKYFANNFYRLSQGSKSQMYDFFLEIYPSEVAGDQYRKRLDNMFADSKEKYIEEVVKFFKKIFRYDSRKNKVYVNKLFKNVRLHYLDIRRYYKHSLQDKIFEITEITNKMMKDDNLTINDLEKIIDVMIGIKEHLQYIIDVLTSAPTKKVPRTKIIKAETRALDLDALDYLANKIKTVYTHNNVKKTMLELIDASVKNFNLTIDEIDTYIKEFDNYINRLRNSDGRLIKDANSTYLFTYGLSNYTIREMLVDVVNKMDRLTDERIVEFFARFTDIYFLRRFLDKDYITNAITYTGALHSNTYVYILVNYFDFKITHASYSKYKDMNKLSDEISRRTHIEIQELILPEFLDQCSNMNLFPTDFK